jgi:hypothetical protein
MDEFDIIIFLSIKIDKVLDVAYKCRLVDFSYKSRWSLGSDATSTKNQLLYIFKQRITARLS